MKANELRIGNYVNFRGEQREVYQIRQTGCDFHIVANDFHSYIWDAIEPTPLTEEWLLKLGFKSNPYNDTYYLDNIYFEGCKLVFECNKTRGFTELWSDDFPLVKHVHQLQNLYFALTGEELTLINK